VFVEPAAGPGATGHTLQQVVDAAPAADNASGAGLADVLAGKVFWSLRTDGTWGLRSGSLATRTLDASTTTVLAGYYAATTLVVVDSDLATGNVRAGVSIFGVNGNTNVVNTSTGTPATAPDLLAGKTAYANGNHVSGSFTPEAAL